VPRYAIPFNASIHATVGADGLALSGVVPFRETIPGRAGSALEPSGASMGSIPKLLVSILALAIPWCAQARDSRESLTVGERVFRQSCAVCHGARGRPDADNPVAMALDPPPADLSDPLFNSREPALDWELVVKHGGHALGLSDQMPAQAGNLTDEEIKAVVAYVKTLAETSDYPPGELNLLLPARTKKAYPEDEIVWHSRWEDRDGADIWRNVLEYEKRIGRRGQGILELVQEDNGFESELEEIEVGYKHALAWNLDQRYLLSGALVAAFPTDDDASVEIIPYLAYATELSPASTLQASGRLILPIDDVDQGTFELAAAMHWVWSDWPRRPVPAIEATAAVPFNPAPGEDDVAFTVLPQVRFGLTRGGHVALNLGVEIPLSNQDYDYRAHLTLLWDFADGSFFQGW
jgi:mono/diheme cytochrome c family protein